MVLHFVIAAYLSVFHGVQSQYHKNIIMILGGIALISPFILYLSASQFASNIKWMINTLYSRKQMLLFHLLVQPARFILLFVPCIFYSIFQMEKKSKLDLLSLSEIYDSINVTTLMVTFSVVYIIPLVVIARQSILKQQVIHQKKKLPRKKLVLSAIAFVVLFSFFIELIDSVFPSDILGVWFVNCVVGLLIVKILLGSFRVLNSRKMIRLLAVIFLLFTFITIGEYAKEAKVVESSEYSAKDQLSSYLYLGRIAPEIDKNKFKDLLKIGNNSQKRDLISLNLHQVTDVEVLSYNIEMKNAGAGLEVIVERTKKFDGDQLREIILKLSDYTKDKSLSNYAISRLHRIILRSSYVDEDNFIHDMLDKKNRFRNYTGVELIVHHTPKELQWEKLKQYVEHIDSDLISNGFGKGKVPKEYLEYLKSKKSILKE
jgi:hypothetical protein